MPSKQRMKGQKQAKGKGKEATATLAPEETVESPTEVEESQPISETQLDVSDEQVVSSISPEFGNTEIVKAPTSEVPVAIAEAGEPKQKSAAQKKWREKNRSKVQDYQKKWRASNKEKVKDIHTNYRKKNPEKVKAWQKASQERRKQKSAEEKAAQPNTETTA